MTGPEPRTNSASGRNLVLGSDCLTMPTDALRSGPRGRSRPRVSTRRSFWHTTSTDSCVCLRTSARVPMGMFRFCGVACWARFLTVSFAPATRASRGIPWLSPIAPAAESWRDLIHPRLADSPPPTTAASKRTWRGSESPSPSRPQDWRPCGRCVGSFLMHPPTAHAYASVRSRVCRNSNT